MIKLHNLLLKENLKLVTVESITSGLISASITKYSGASRYYLGGYNVYSKEAKNLLGVSYEFINKFGTCSKEMSEELASHVSLKFNADYILSITGNAGPNAVESKKVGEVYLVIKSRDNIYHKQFNINLMFYSRERIRKIVTKLSLEYLYNIIIKEKNNGKR